MDAWLVLFLTLPVSISAGANYGNRDLRLNIAFKWKTPDFLFPSSAEREAALSSGKFTRASGMTMGIEQWRNKLFVTTPRTQPGVPATLSYLDINSDQTDSPLLRPYPDWKTNELVISGPSSVESLHWTSVYRARADECNRLWVIDSGIANTGMGNRRAEAPKLVVLDLLTDRVLVVHQFLPQLFDATRSFHANLVVDVSPDSCDDAFAYLPDLGTRVLLVYSLASDSMYQISHPFFSFEPIHTDLTVGGVNFQLSDGIFSVALSPRRPGEKFRTLYFHALAAENEFAVSTEVIRNETAARNYHAYRLVGTRGRTGISTVSNVDQRSGVLFTAEVLNHRVTCWDPLTGQMCRRSVGVVADNSTNEMMYPSDLTVSPSGLLWINVCNMPQVRFNRNDPNVYNNFIYSVPVVKAIERTVCDKAYRPHGNF